MPDITMKECPSSLLAATGRQVQAGSTQMSRVPFSL
jgi:hypothetical protein